MIRSSHSALIAAALAVSGQPLHAQAPSITATKSDGTAAATKKNPGDTVTYTNVISNAAGAGAATGVEFSDPDPTGATVVPTSLKVSPIAFNDSYTQVIAANTTINTATASNFSVLTNDYKGVAAGVAATVTISPTTVTSANGGTVNFAADGTFTYAPAPGYVGADSFNYTITNNGGTLTNTGTVSLTVSGPVVWYVATSGNDTTGDGTLTKKFATVAKAATAALAGHKIHVASGAYTGTTDVTLAANVKLIGEGATGAGFDAFVLDGLAPGTDTPARPAINGTRPTITRSNNGNVVTLGDGSAILGCTVNSTVPGYAVAGGFGVNSATIGSAAPSDTRINASGTSTGGLSLGGTGNGTVNVNAPIVSSAGNSVNISGRSSGSVVNVVGKITDTGAGVSLVSNNSGSTVNFRSVSLTTTVNTGFGATNGGVVNITNGLADGVDNDGVNGVDDAAEVNTITTTTGTALSLVSTTIGASGLNFRSINSSTAGTNAGIVLKNTGTQGGLTVTGTGTAGSGGTIANKSGGNITANSGVPEYNGATTGAGIILIDTAHVSLTRMQLNDFSNYAIYGNGVTNFSLTESVISGVSGQDGAANEGAILFGALGSSSANGLVGTATFSNLTISGGFEDNVVIRNRTGTLSQLTVSGCTIRDNSTVSPGNEGFLVQADGSAVITADFTNCSFLRNRANGVHVITNDAGTVNVAVGQNGVAGSGGTFTNNNIGVHLAHNSSGTFTAGVYRGTFSATAGSVFASPINVNLGSSASNPMHVTLDGNLISNANSPTGPGVRVVSNGSAGPNNILNFLANNNTISQIGNRGMEIIARDGNSTINATVTNNSVQLTDPLAADAIRVDAGTTSTDTVTVALDAAGNDANTIAGLFGIRVRQRFAGTSYRLEGYGGGASDTTAVNNYLAARNPLSTPFSSDLGGSGFVNIANVPTPTAPLFFAREPDDVSSPVMAAPAPAEVAAVVPAAAVPVAVSPVVEAPAVAERETVRLTQEHIDSLVAEARARWEAIGLSTEQKQRLDKLRFEISDLETLQLGQAGGDLIQISRSAAGNEWFIDETPADDSEFSHQATATRRGALAGDAARDRVDLLTTILHEMGHSIGLCDSYSNLQRDSVMYGFLSKGERRLPAKGQAAGAVPHAHGEAHFLSAPVVIGTLPPGKSVTIIYDAVINNPLTAVPVSSQGTVRSSTLPITDPGYFADKLTDDLVNGGDPLLPGAADPTVTAIERPDTAVASVTRASANPTNASTVTWQVTFNHALSGLTASNFSLVNTGLGGSPAITGVTEAVGPPSAVWNVTATTGSGDGSLGLNVVNDANLTYDVTNLSFTGQAYTLDRTGPGATVVLADSALKAGETSGVTITFTEFTNGFDNNDLTFPNGTLSSVTTSDNIVWTATFTPDADVTDATNVITLDKTGVTDALGNVGVGTSVSLNYTVDTKSATVGITVADLALKIGDTPLVTFTFSEPVSGLDLADLTVGNGSLSAPSSSDGGTVWTATLTPTAGVTAAANVITLNNTGVEDAAGNPGTGTTDSESYAIDTARPTVTIVVTDTALAAGETSLVTFTFSEAVSGLAEGDLTVENGSVSTPTTANNVTWTATLTPTAAVNDSSNVITLNNTGVEDAAGNTGAGSTPSNNYQIDTVRPTAGIVVADNKLIAGETSLVTISFNEPVADLTTTDFTTANGLLSLLSTSDGGTNWTATLTPATGVEDTSNLITLDNTGVQDAAGNAGTGTTDSNNYEVDTARPTATIVVADTELMIGEDSLVTITFSEAVTNFDNNDLTLENGTLTNVTSGNGGITWTATFTPTPNITDATNVITLDNTGVQDAAGNAGTGTTTSNNYAITSLSVSIAAVATDAAEGTGAGTTAFTFTVSRTGSTSGEVTMDYAVTGAANAADFGGTLPSGSFIIPDTQASATLTVNVGQDTVVEPDEAFTVTISNASGGYVVSTAAVSSTINNDDAATVTVAKVNDGAETNSPSNGLFRITQSAASSADSLVKFTVGGTAGSGTDYTAIVGSVTIAAGSTTADIVVPVLTDDIVEGTETVTIDLDSVASTLPGVTLGATDTASLDITDDDTATVVIAKVNDGAETNTPSNGKFRVTQSAVSSSDTVVSYTVGGSAAAGADYTALGSSVTILAGETTADIDVAVLGDAVIEGTETVSVTLSGFSAADANISLGVPASASLNVTDDDAANVVIAKVNDGAETNTPTNGLFRVTQSAVSASDTVVSYTVGGSATGGSDYTVPSGSVTITAGQTTADISIPVLTDALVETTETVSITLSGVTSGGAVATGVPATASLDITDDDTATVVIAKINDGAETNTPSNGLFRVTQSAASSSATVISYTIGGSATSASDYTALSGSVTIAAGQTTADIGVEVLNDAIVETTETVSVTLTGFTARDADVGLGATVNASADITDNDTANIVLAKIDDGAETSTPANALFRVTQSSVSSSDTVLTYTVGGSAVGGGDYTALSGSVTIAAGQVTADISVPVLDDTILEGTETVSVTLTGFTARDADVSLSGIVSATADITDDDSTVVTIAKINDGAETNTPANALFRVTQGAASSTDTVVSYSVGGSATSGSDYTALTGSVTIVAGQTTADISVAVLNDAIVETTETVGLTLTGFTAGDTGVALGATVSATANITDNDTANVVLAKINDGAETNTPANGLFRVTQSAISSSNTVVTYSVGGSTTGGSDYSALGGSVTIPAGQTTADISVEVLNDAIVEITETVSLTLTGFSSGDADISLGATVASSLNITDNDAANVVVAKVNDGAESNTPVNAVFRVTQSAISSSNTVLTYSLGGTAAGGSDYTLVSGNVTIPAGQLEADISVPVLNDQLVEGTETVTVTLTGITSGDSDVSLSGIVNTSANITDDDVAVLSVAKLNDGAESYSPVNARFRISLSKAVAANLTAGFSISGSASSGADFTALSSPVAIGFGATTVDVTVPVLNDNQIEPTETVVLTLTSVSGHPAVSIAANPGNTASLDITDSDVAANIAVDSGNSVSTAVNTAFPIPFVALVTDSSLQPLAGASVTFTVVGGAASGSFTGNTTVITDANGLATSPVLTANTVTGAYQVTASTPGVSGVATFQAINYGGPEAAYAVSAPANVIAGQDFQVEVTALDQYGNRAFRFNGWTHVTSTDSAATLPADFRWPNIVNPRTFTARLATGGNQTITATDTVTASITGTSNTINVSPRSDLAVTISDSPDPVNASGNLTYTIQLTNNGPSAAVDPSITLPVPASTTFVSSTAPANWVQTTPAVGGTGTVTVTGQPLASGATATFTVVVKVDLTVVNDSTLTALVSASSTTTDPDSGNNSASTTTLAKSGADLQLALTDAPDPVIAGTELVYTLQVQNNGPLDAENVSITDNLPVGTTFVGLIAPAGWSATTPAVGANGTVTITRPLFANAATASFTLITKVAPNVANGTVLSDTAAISSTTIDIAPGNNSATADTTVNTSADLAVQISRSPATAPKGSNVTFTVTVANNGPSDSTAPVVTLPVPAQMTFVSAAKPGAWSVTNPAVGGTGNVTFTSGSLATGASATFTVVAKVNAAAPTGTILTATATVSGKDTDPVGGNNSASVTTAVGTVAPSVIQPVTNNIPVNSQTGLFDVTVNVTNTTPNPINGFRLHVDYTAYKAAFPSLRLYNATSAANATDVYVDYPYPMAVNAVVSVKLSFYTSTRTFPSPFKPGLTVEILPNSQVPGTNGKGVQPRLVRLENKDVLLEFPSVAGKWYRVRYSADMKNWYDCPVPLQAGSSRMQWIDSGPPFTNVPPSQAPSRFYLVNEIKAP